MRQLFLLSLIVFNAHLLVGQNGLNKLWQNEIANSNGPKKIELHAVVNGANGTAVVGASSVKEGTRMYIAKYQTDGQLSWATTLTSSSKSFLNYVQEDEQGNYYAAGTEIIGAFFDRQVHVAKISSSGQLMWHITYKSPGNAYSTLYDLKLKGNYLYICGEGKGAKTYKEAWLAKINLDGSVVWDKNFESEAGTIFYKMSIDNAESVAVVGSADDGYSVLAAQYNSSGMLQWQYPDTLSGENEASFADVIHDESGNIYAIGSWESTSFDIDILTQKLSSTGKLLWDNKYTSGSENEGVRIVLGADGNVYSFGNKELNFDDSALAISYSTDGSKLWEKSYTIDDGTILEGVFVTASGDIYFGVRDFREIALVKISSGGVVQKDKKYAADQLFFLTDISLYGNELVAVSYLQGEKEAHLTSLNAETLEENFIVKAQGKSISDTQVGSMVSAGNHQYISTFANDGDSATFAITKMSNEGQIQWEKTKRFATAYPSFPYLVSDDAGNVAGLFQNKLNLSTGYLGIMMFDAQGREKFTVVLDSASVFLAGGIALDNQGNCYIVGYNAATKKMFTSCYNSNGIVQWTKFYQSPNASSPYTSPFLMHYTNQGKLVIAALNRGLGNPSYLHLFQYSTNGVLEWDKDISTQGGSTYDIVKLQSTANGDLFIFASTGSAYYMAAKYDKNGNKIWEETGFPPFRGSPRSMALDEQNNVYLSFSSDKAVHVRKLNAKGEFVVDNQISAATSGAHYFPKHSIVSNKQLIILGDHLMTIGAVPFQMVLSDLLEPQFIEVDSLQRGLMESMTVDGSGSLYGAYLTGALDLQGYRGTLIRKYSLGTVGFDKYWADNSIKVYPNPTQGNFRIDLGEQHELITITVSNLLGQLVSSSVYENTSSIYFKLKGDAGLYFVTIRINNMDASKTLKILKK